MAENSDDNMTVCAGESAVRMKLPKRVLHFSDGTIEEFTDSETEELPTETDTSVMPNTEGWGPWLLFKLRSTGSTTLAACDYVGEALASFLGITSPRYQYELEEYQKIAKEKLEHEAKEKGWSTPADGTPAADVTVEQPLNNNAPTHV